MKKIIMAITVIASIGAITIISSCTKDECADVVCQNGGTCSTGTCDCDAGYEGTLCETEVRGKYLGALNGGEVCSSDPSVTVPISVNITTVSSDVTKVNFNNLYGAGFNTTGTVQADGSITIATQTFGTGSISGSAIVDAGKVKITYVITSGGASDNCTWTQN